MRPTCRFQAVGFSFGGLGAGNSVASVSWTVPHDIVVHSVTGHIHFGPPTAAGWAESVIVQAGFGFQPPGITALGPVLSDGAIFSRSYTGTNNRPESVVSDMMNEYVDPFFVGASKLFTVGFTPVGAGGFAGASIAFGFFNIAWNSVSEWNRRK